MYVVTNTDNEIGPFDTYEDAVSFIAKVEELSPSGDAGLEVLDLTSPEEWLHENMNDILMANC